MGKPPFIHRVKLRNYKSIARCDVELGPLAILVGPNGSGKSNFLDALALTRQALYHTLDHALRERGGISEVRRRSGGHPSNFAIDLHFTLPGGKRQGRYSFEVTSLNRSGYAVRSEICEVSPPDAIGEKVRFAIQEGEIADTNVEVMLPKPASDRLFLVSASNLAEFRPVYDALTAMNFYKFDLAAMRQPQTPEADDILHTGSGYNLAGVLGEIERNDPKSFDCIQSYLRYMVPGMEFVNRVHIPMVNMETIRFVQQIVDWDAPLEFTAINMSDGTLRMLAILTALRQGVDAPPSLVGIGEPETSLYPAAAGALWDALSDGAERTQVLVTTHSPDLLDRKDVPVDTVLAVDMDAGKTRIGPVAANSRRVLQERLATMGELLRQGMLSPDEQLTYPQSYMRF